MKSLSRAAIAAFLIILEAMGIHAYDDFFGADLDSNAACTTGHPNSDDAREDFLSNLSSYESDGFESFLASQGLSLSLTFGDMSAVFTGGTGFVF